MEEHSQDTQLGGCGVPSVLLWAAAAPASLQQAVPRCVEKGVTQESALEVRHHVLYQLLPRACFTVPTLQVSTRLPGSGTYFHAGVGQKRDGSNKMDS